MRSLLRYAIALLALSGAARAGQPAAAPAPRYRVEPFVLPGPVEKLIVADLDGDAALDVLCARAARLDVYFQRPGGGFSFEKPGASLELTARATGFCVAPLERGGPPTVTALIDGARVVSWPMDRAARAFLEPKPVLSGLAGLLPRGVHYLPFVRDVDGDGLADFVIAGPAAFQVHLRGDGGEWRRIQVPADIEIRSSLSPRRLTDKVGQSVTVPLFALRDVNADGRRDLISKTDDRLEAYLAGPAGEFPAGPTFALDLAAARAQLGSFDPDDIDWSNLTGLLAKWVQVSEGDVNGDRMEDIVLRAGGKVSLYLGGKDGIDPARPSQVLKSSGNVAFASLEDENGDGRPDLWLLRVEEISVGDVLIWLVASGKLGIDIFIYRNEGQRFASRPSRRIEAVIRFPSVLSIAGQVDDIEDELEGKQPSPNRPADLVGRGQRRDLVVARGGRLLGYLGKARPPSTDPKAGVLKGILERFGYRPDLDRYTIDLTNVKDLLMQLANEAGGGEMSVAPDLDLPLPGEPRRPGLWIADFDGDGRDDALLIHERSAKELRGSMVFSSTAAKTGRP